MAWHAAFERVNRREYFARTNLGDALDCFFTARWENLVVGLWVTRHWQKTGQNQGLQWFDSYVGTEYREDVLRLKFAVEVTHFRWERRSRQLCIWFPYFAGLEEAPVDPSGSVLGDSASEDEDLGPERPAPWSWAEGPPPQY